MALNGKPRAEAAAHSRAVAPAETAAPWSNWTGRVGALSALARLAAFRQGGRILTYALLGALIGVLLLVAAATLPVLFGYHNYVVQGGSMGASLKAGSAAVTKPTSPYDLGIGDVIARRQSEDGPAVLHRIVDIRVEDGQRLFITQGDANRTPDPKPVALEGPGDKVVLTVPYAGYILDFAGTGQGRLLLIGAPLALLAAMVVREKRRPPQEKKGSGAGRTAEGGAAKTRPLAATSSSQEEETPREAASVLIQPPRLWPRVGLVLVLLPLTLSLLLALADPGRRAVSRQAGGFQP